MSLFPRLSPDGRSVITQGLRRYGPCWLDDAAYVSYVGNGPGISTSSGQFYPWPEPDLLTAGGGLFAANYWTHEHGIRLSAGFFVPDGFHGALSDTGRLVYLTGHELHTQTLQDVQGVTYDSGAALEYPRACRVGLAWSRYTPAQVHETHWAEWGRQKQRVHASGALTEFRPVPVSTPSGIWIACYTHLDVRLYEVGTTRGYLIPSVDARALDAKWNGVGIRLVWNGPAGQLYDEVVSLAESMVPLDVPAPPPITVPAINKPCWCGFFTFNVPPASLPGNCDLRVQPDPILRTWAGQPIARYVEGTPDGDVDSLEAHIANAKTFSPKLPVIGYWPRSMTRVPRGVDWLGVEAYQGARESLADFETRVRASIARFPKVALICQVYHSNLSLTPYLASLVPLYAKLARDCPQVIALIGFSGSGRATGLQDHAEIQPLWRALAAGIPGHPPLPVNDTPLPPTPPVPRPPLPETPMPTMSFDKSLALVDELAHLWQQFNPPASPTQPDAHLRCDWGQLHLYFWRATVEGWSHDKCIDAFYVQHGRPAPVHP